MKILVAQLAYLGDVILSTPIIGALKSKYPNAAIYLLTTPAAEPLFIHDPRLAGIISFEKRGLHKGFAGIKLIAEKLKAENFDVVYSAHRSIRTAIVLYLAGIKHRVGFKDSNGSFLYNSKIVRKVNGHAAERLLSILSIEKDFENYSSQLKLFPPDASSLRSDLVAEFKLKSNFISLFPGSSWATKRWTLDNYKSLIKKIEATGLCVVVMGSKSEFELCQAVVENSEALNLSGKTSLDETLWIMSNSIACICNDSMAIHMASALGVANLSIFCSTVPEFGFGPWKNTSRIAEISNLPCRPCGRHGRSTCPTGTEACMKDLLPEVVFSEFNKLMENSNSTSKKYLLKTCNE